MASTADGKMPRHQNLRHSFSKQAPDEWVLNAVHRLQDPLQQMLALTQRRSHKTVTERATSVSKGNVAYAAMEAVIMAREWQDEARHDYDLKFAEAARKPRRPTTMQSGAHSKRPRRSRNTSRP